MTISQISLGNTFTNTSGTTVVGGLSSGLNTQSVINGIVAAQSAQITPLQDQVTVNNNQVSALATLQQLLTAIQTSAATLASPQSPDSTSNLWLVNTTSVTGNTTQDASNFLTATATSGTATGTYTISNITSVASNTSQVLGTTFNSATATAVASSATTGEFTAGTYTITGNNGATGSVTLSAGDSLTQVAADFNSASSSTGIAASVVETSEGVYTLAFSSTATGQPTTAFDLSTAGLGDVTFGATSAGTNAVFDFNGIPVDRPTNTITDLVSGVTFNLLQAPTESGASFTVQIAADTNSIAEGITGFANAYNSFLTFYAQQTALNSSGTPASSALLYSDTTLRTIYNEVTNEASSLIQGISTSNPSSLAAIGISFANTPATTTTPEVDNTLSIDSSQLLTSLESNFTGVEDVFGAAISATNSDSSTNNNVSLFQSPTNAGITSFTLNVSESGTSTITYDDPTLGSTTVNLTSSPLSGGSGVVLTVPANDGALSGLSLIYGSASDASGITVNLSQGIADQINNTLNGVLESNTGLIADDETAIQTKTTSVNTQITTITNQVAATRQELLTKFAALEAAITEANSSLNLLNAQQLAGSSSS